MNDLSRAAAARLIKSHLVTVNGETADPADRVAAGDVIELEVPEAYVTVAVPEAIPLEVVFEDEDLLVINKPAGMVVHPAPGHHSGTLVHALLGRGGSWSSAGGAARPGIVHRLDKGTSGLIVVARNDVSHRALSSQLSDRTLSRSYLAIARGRFKTDAGELEGAIHLAALGHPIAGDAEYGGRGPGEPDRPMLHAWRLRLRHPRTRVEMSFEVAPPADFEAFWALVK